RPFGRDDDALGVPGDRRRQRLDRVLAAQREEGVEAVQHESLHTVQLEDRAVHCLERGRGRGQHELPAPCPTAPPRAERPEPRAERPQPGPSADTPMPTLRAKRAMESATCVASSGVGTRTSARSADAVSPPASAPASRSSSPSPYVPTTPAPAEACSSTLPPRRSTGTAARCNGVGRS